MRISWGGTKLWSQIVSSIFVSSTIIDMNKRESRVCSKHGTYEHVLEKNGYYRCRRCRNDGVIQRRKKVKHQLVMAHGGKCKRCGYNTCIDALEFHHIDPTKKFFGISAQGGKTLSIARFLQEAKKCLLLCANCHREVESGLPLNC